MEKIIAHKISWTTIYSLGLLPLIVVWGLPLPIGGFAIAITSIIIGAMWTSLSTRLIQYPQGCGFIGWITGGSMIVGGFCKMLLLKLDWNHVPEILFLAPLLSFGLYFFESHKQQPSFCHQCIAQRGGIQERKFLGDYSRYEARYISHTIFGGGIAVTLLSWGLFIYGIEQESRMGIFFYHYLPIILVLAVIFFEIVRRILIQYIFDSHEKKSKQSVSHGDKFVVCYTSIRIIAICQGKIYLSPKEKDSPNDIEEDTGLDTPLYKFQNYTLSLAEEKELASKSVKELLQIDKANLRHINSTTAPTYLRRMGQYLLFLPAEEKSKLDTYKGNWYSTQELHQLYRNNELYPLFSELYARIYTIYMTAQTYCQNGKRRFPQKEYTPTFSLEQLEKSDIEFDNPIWLYVSRHNEDKFLYRLHQKLTKLFSKKKPHA